MSERKIRHVEDIFGGAGPPQGQNILERKTSFNIFKNKKAPQPPPGRQALPRIGSYQPKICLDAQANAEQAHNGTDNSDYVNGNTAIPAVSNHGNSQPKPMVIGDKDELFSINHDIEEMDEVEPVPAPRRKRKAPDAPGDIGSANDLQALPTNNPVFGRSTSHRSDQEPLDLSFEEQGGDIDFGEGIDNPGFRSRARNESSSSYQTSLDPGINSDNRRSSDHQITYPYIPPPDYEDEEITLDFGDNIDPGLFDYNKNRHSAVHREQEGDDFGKYMDDDFEFDPPCRRPMHPAGHFGKTRQPSKSPVQPKWNNKKPDKKSKKKQEKHEANMKRNTIRDFTFSDSKIGWGDRTVKSTSAKGRYIKREKDRKRIEASESFVKNNKQSESGPGSYEDFLRAKNGNPLLESPNSSDSGVEMSEDNRRVMEDTYLHSQPKQMRSSNNKYYDKKASVWQRLTWRFRRSVTVTRTESERL